ncbi:hypothetical protein SFC66_08895 [Terribacillus saccharophilus]|uniref:hypothetical protein n=1 Tax=Terribacillus saccharophilus TaxID=361277 RepID=UPI003982BAEC
MYSNHELQNVISGQAVGDSFPYNTNDETEIEAHIRRLYHYINHMPHIVCEAEWNHFGSGYSSYVEFYCYSRKDVTVVQQKDNHRVEEREGIIIAVCRLAPVAIMGADDRYRMIHSVTNEEVGRGYGSLLDGPDRLYVGEELQNTAEKLKAALQIFGFELMDAKSMGAPLPFQTIIPTIYRKPGEYLYMDALFYWED